MKYTMKYYANLGICLFLTSLVYCWGDEASQHFPQILKYVKQKYPDMKPFSQSLLAREFWEKYGVNFEDVSPGHISEKDLYYYLRKSKKEYDSKIEAVKAFDESFKEVWHDPNEGDDWAVMGYEMLVNSELVECQWLTMGNVIKILGPPIKISQFNDLYFPLDEMNERLARLKAYYKKEEVELEFSCTGFLTYYLYNYQKKCANKMGGGEWRWPHRYYFTDHFPIYAGSFSRDEDRLSLTNTASKYFSTFHCYEDWEKFVFSRKSVVKDKIESQHQIMLVDGIINDLARVYVQIQAENKDTLIADTWWKNESGKWIIMDNEQAIECFNDK